MQDCMHYQCPYCKSWNTDFIEGQTVRYPDANGVIRSSMFGGMVICRNCGQRHDPGKIKPI